MHRLVLSTGIVLAAASWSPAQDWVIGAGDPNEVVTQTTDVTVNGSVIILNNGQLDLQGAVLTVNGDVFVLNTASLNVTGGTLRFVQSFSYERKLFATDAATLQFLDATVDSGGAYVCAIGLQGTAAADFTRVTVSQGGGATWTFWDQSSLTMTDCIRGHEFISLGTGNITISGTDGVMFWMTLPDGSVVDTMLPPPGTVAAWSVGPSSPWASGIPYSASLTNCTNVTWGVMAQSGCSGTFRDSTLRAVGSYFDRSNAVTVQGVANNASLTDTSYAWGDVALRFVNTFVQSWNFYPIGTTQLTLSGCLFGELLVSQTGSAWVEGSMCDGSGGYMSASGDGTLVFVTSMNLSQTTCSQNATLVAFHSALLSPAIDATDNAVIQLLNTEYVGEPAARDAATIFDLAVDPVDAPAGETVSLRGTARMVTGPTSPFTFQGFSLEYGVGDQPAAWIPIGGPYPNEVRDATLGTWDTCRVLPGDYSVQVLLHHNLGDPVTVSRSVLLTDTPGVGRGTGDFDCDGAVDLADRDVFVAVLLGLDADPVDHWIADMDADGVANGGDIQLFVGAVLGR